MAKIVYQTIEESAADRFVRPGVSTTGEQTDLALITGEDRSLHLLMRTMKKGAGISYDALPTSRGIYLWKGAIEVNGTDLEEGDSIVVERGGTAALQATTDNTVLVEFVNHLDQEPKEGGHVHILPKRSAPARGNPQRLSNMTVYADSGCETCTVWLHHVSFGIGGPGAAPHSHDEDEIIFVLEGEMLVGTKSVKAGTAVAIDKDTVYGFAIGPDGLEFLNFRARDPETIFKEPGGGRRVFMERDHFHNLPA